MRMQGHTKVARRKTFHESRDQLAGFPRDSPEVYQSPVLPPTRQATYETIGRKDERDELLGRLNQSHGSHMP